MRQHMRCLAVFAIVGLFAAVDPPSGTAQGKRPSKPTDVKVLTRSVACDSYDGVVDSIDADGLILTEKLDGGRVQLHRFVPIDLLREGLAIDDSFGMYTYRWADVKVGDTVTLKVLKDDRDGLTYCLRICITRRPGENLPESQRPKDDSRYKWDRIFNALENGEDVSDEELNKAWPAIHSKRTGEFYPAGMPTRPEFNKYHDLLAANRKRIVEEKEKGVKTKPADGKGEVKKDDKK